MKIYNMSETKGGGMEARFYIDGKRVSRATFQTVEREASRLDCFHTRAWPVAGGKTRRTNYKSAYM